jgi:hypothetical protein
MPVISRFYGIIVRIFTETGARHSLPHIHIAYQEFHAVYCIEPVELLEGALPRRQRRLAEAWIELYQQELMENWRLANAGKPIQRIPPLQR